jgi:hypothetical protein
MAERDVERLKEQIKYKTEILKTTALIAVATGGGSIAVGADQGGDMSLTEWPVLGAVAVVGLSFIAMIWKITSH